MKRVKKYLSNLFLYFCLVLLVSNNAKAIEVKIEDTEVKNYGVQEILVGIKSDTSRTLEVDTLLLDNKNNIINKNSVIKKLEPGQNFEITSSIQMIENPYCIKLKFKDRDTGKELYQSKIIKVDGAKESVVDVVNPVISVVQGEECRVPDSLKGILNNGEEINLNIMSLEEDIVDTSETGIKKILVMWMTEDYSQSDTIYMTFEVLAGKPVKEITPLSKSIRINEKIELPDFVQVTYEDNTTVTKRVEWMSKPDTSIAGEQIIKGKVSGTILLAEFKLFVDDYQLDDVYEFKNLEIKELVEDTLDKENLTYNDLLELKELSLAYAIYEDTNLMDFRYFKNLENLDASFLTMLGKPIDYSPLSELTSLKSLNLFSSSVNSIEFIKELVNLEYLNLASNNLSDVSALRNLSKLKKLNLTSNNKLESIKALRWTNNLIDLELPNTVEDLTPIIEYNDNLTQKFDINLLRVIDSKVIHEESPNKYYYLPYAVENDGEIIYVDWEKEKVKVDGTQEIKGIHNGQEITFILNEISRDNNEIIEIKDKIFEQEVRKLIDKKYGDITYGDIKNLKKLDLSGKDIKDFTGLENFVGLEVLKVWAVPEFANNNNIEKIKTMKKLQYIDLGSIGLKSISSDTFKDLAELLEIAIDNNLMYEIPYNAFETNINLKYLHINGTGINNLNCLKNLNNLECLYADENIINDIEGLKFTPNLTTLNLAYNKIKKTDPISNLANLETLYLEHNNISDISSFDKLTKIKSIRLNNNQVNNIDSLVNMMGLESLYLDNNEVEDLSSLENKKLLKYLQFKNNKVTSIRSLKDLTNLRVLWLDGNNINDINLLKPIYGNLTNKDFKIGG